MTVGVAILGSTGSIGTATLRVIERQKDLFKVVALTALESEDLLHQQAAAVGADFVGLVNGEPGRRKQEVGPRCLVEAATHPDAQIVVNAVVGAAGLEATIAALRANKRVALANKETMVMAGDLVLEAARSAEGQLLPIDSEHSAVLQCIAGRPRTEFCKLILTASGGPFREWSRERIARATVADALNHPTWAMGRKITVDSATLANKALEVIEAHYFFGLAYDDIDVVVHPQSIVHAFAEFVDGSVLAQVGFPTMELPILYALTYPDRVQDPAVPRFDPVSAGALTFERVRKDAFRTFALGLGAGRVGGTAPTVFNAANEVAVEAFLAGRILFGDIPVVIDKVLQHHEVVPASDLETVIGTDRWAREETEAACS